MPLRHAGSTTPSTWVTRFAPLIAAGGEVLDLACGSGRHARWLVSRGFRVEAADRDAVALELLAGVPHLVLFALPVQTFLLVAVWRYRYALLCSSKDFA